jgi:arginine deiminase
MKIDANINSEIGKLNGVIIHVPGAEVENMTPENAERALYSDILNLTIALPEYNNFMGVLKKYARVFEVKELLNDVISDNDIRTELINKICETEYNNNYKICEHLFELKPETLAVKLIEGVEMHKNNLTRFLDNERYCVHPLPNFFFTRDASFTVGNEILISKMANSVRDREAIIMETIFNHHPSVKSKTIDPVKLYDNTGKATIEGGDVIVARNDVLLIGTGGRTSTQGIDSIIEYLKTKPGTKHIIVQELPFKPESFIHLDMTFTFLDKDQCMIFEPLILNSTRHLTIHITIDGKKVSSIKEEKNLLDALRKLKIDLEPVYCGGNNDITIMEREQWQSGANFFALEPGKIIGYARNVNTIEALNKKGFEVIKSKEIVSGKYDLNDYKKAVVTIEGNELSRGGGGARCMTMPLNRTDFFGF